MHISKQWLIPLCLLGLLTVAGCAYKTDTLYHWGEYQGLLLDTYTNPGSTDTATQIEKLNADIQQTQALGKRVFPGLYAHLGLLYALEGKDTQSKAAFEQEVVLYPESKVFIEGMLNRANQQQENTL